jgi:hypothetical protein
MAMRTHYCGLVTEALLGQTVTLCGWVNRRRDHGGVIFIDLRDREGYVQVVCDPDRADTFAAENLRNEFCVQITGLVRARPEGTTNDSLKSGKIEVLCHELKVLNPSVTPPFLLDDDNLSETTRLTHRVLDLRRPAMQRNLMLRYKVTMEVRKFLDANGFIDIETPMLGKSTPEGARDYLVPSRVHDGSFFALPQSPQLFKQLLMVAGFDRYYQIVKCFRDEDLRADRQPEFTQIDIETSFLAEEEIREMFEGMIRNVFRTLPRRPAGVPDHDVRRRDVQVRLGQARPAREARVHRTHRRDEARGIQGVLQRRHHGRTAAWWHCACPAAVPKAACRAAKSTRTPSSSRSTAPRAWPTSRSTTVAKPAAKACKARSSRTCTTARWPRSSPAPARATATSCSSAPTRKRSSTTPSARCA